MQVMPLHDPLCRDMHNYQHHHAGKHVFLEILLISCPTIWPFQFEYCAIFSKYTRWFHRVYFFLQMFIQKGSLNIKQLHINFFSLE